MIPFREKKPSVKLSILSSSSLKLVFLIEEQKRPYCSTSVVKLGMFSKLWRRALATSLIESSPIDLPIKNNTFSSITCVRGWRTS